MSETLSSRAAPWTQRALLVTAVALATLIAAGPGSPWREKRAHADIAAAPGYLLLSATATNADKFFIVDTDKQVICMYTLAGQKLRLMAARKFDNDSIFDTSLNLPHNGKQLKAIEGNPGASRKDAGEYKEALTKAMEEAAAKK